MDIDDPRLVEARKKFDERSKRIADMMLNVVTAQVTVEGLMNDFLLAHDKDPKRLFYTAPKIKECKTIDPPEVGAPMWDLLSLCSHVRNELVHSLNDAEIKIRSNAVREAYLALTEHERQKQSIREMTDTQMVTSALYTCGSHIFIATDNWLAKGKRTRNGS